MQSFGFDIPNPEGPFNPPRFPDLPSLPPFQWELPVWRDLLWSPAQIKILVVCDGNSYSTDPQDGFSLGIALQDAFDPTNPEHPSYARFNFTKAYRNGTTAGVTQGFENFRFNADSLAGFDELWLFGFIAGAPYLDQSEVAIIEAFMDAGGGVLAMGDHEDLGLGLCGGIKRVRSMRKWWFQSPPAGMLQAPDSTNLTRNDTEQPPFPSSQSDAIPQPIYPVYSYIHLAWRSWWQQQKYPHPILCGPRGAITVLPDHAHEGDCIIPDPMFAGEYTGGVAVEIIAHGRNVIGREKGGYVISEPREFGLIGVWDGHNPAASQGRVVVDSTWHHWFNINISGLKINNGNDYRDILAYFRNVAIWLAPPSDQAKMRRAGQRIILLIPSMVETMMTLDDIRPDLFYPLGVQARDALGRIAPQCQSAAWFFETISPFLSDATTKIASIEKFEGVHNLVEAAAINALSTTIFGGVINAIAVEMNKRGLDKLDSWDEELDSIAAIGGKIALEAANKQINAAQKTLKTMLG